MHILVTGGCGFIGSHLVRMILRRGAAWRVTNLDALTYAANPGNLADITSDAEMRGRYQFVQGDVCDDGLVERLVGDCAAVMHLAAESHVDRSIADGTVFVQTNVLGTQAILEAILRARKAGKFAGRLVHVSTDEVYGELPLEPREVMFTEESPLKASSPYAASKAGADLLVQAYRRTYGIDACITRCSNNFGSHQYPEKVIPLFVTNLMKGQPVPLYGEGANVRDWIHVEDHCEALLAVLEQGRAGEVYNIGARNQWSNRELTMMLLKIMGKGEEMIRRVPDRLGHDLRYAIDPTKIERELGWKATRSQWPGALAEVVRWYEGRGK